MTEQGALLVIRECDLTTGVATGGAFRSHPPLPLAISPGLLFGTRVLFRYLRQLDRARIILWCYAIWYIVVLVRYFDPNVRLWMTSLGLSAIIGCALLLSTRAAIGSTRLAKWGIFRLFLMPFCVSSFSALVKGRGFVLVFSPQHRENLLALGLCAAFCGLVAALKRLA